MFRIDTKIIETAKVIDENIEKNISDRGFVSQNILSQLRNLVEYVMVKIVYPSDDIDPFDYDLKKDCCTSAKITKNKKYKFLYQLRGYLEYSASHYTFNKSNSEALMLKYLEYLFKIRTLLKEDYNISILSNLESFPIKVDTQLTTYYTKIAKAIESSSIINYDYLPDRYYVKSSKPIFVNGNIYYEIVFSLSKDKINKFDRIIAFTKLEIPTNYSVKLSGVKTRIKIMETSLDIMVINAYSISIRPCEVNNFCWICGYKSRIQSSNPAYIRLMNYLTESGNNLLDLILLDDREYNQLKRYIYLEYNKSVFFKSLDRSREIILNKEPGSNVLRYILYTMNNSIIKSQSQEFINGKLSNLCLKNGTIPFDTMPFCTSPIGHKLKFRDLYQAIPYSEHEHELLARTLIRNVENNGSIFTKIDEFSNIKNLDRLIETYNSLLHPRHQQRSIVKNGEFLYQRSYVEDLKFIIDSLNEMQSTGINQYSLSVDSWLQSTQYQIDDPQKVLILKSMFENSRIAIINGAAGTGKTTMVNHISNFWSNRSKMLISTTHPAVDNLRNKVNAPNCRFSTIAKYISNDQMQSNDILIIDECSMISNRNMKNILSLSTFRLLVLVGDSYQIESIDFGNWFEIIQPFLNKSVYTLEETHRTSDKRLKQLWKIVRDIGKTNKQDYLLEIITGNEFSTVFNATVFDRSSEDEIVLCLNYDGLYGINNINNVLQSRNPSPEITIGVNAFKKGDPILFNDSMRFAPLIHNNSKGIISAIEETDTKVRFVIELDKTINELDAEGLGLELIGISENNNSIIAFDVDKFPDTDNDDRKFDATIVPFQIAYAVSIHKAQGLEYDSVKIIISDNIADKITYNVFYTSITRAKHRLKIYWSPETEHAILTRFKEYFRDKHITLQKNIGLLKKLGFIEK